MLASLRADASAGFGGASSHIEKAVSTACDRSAACSSTAAPSEGPPAIVVGPARQGKTAAAVAVDVPSSGATKSTSVFARGFPTKRPYRPNRPSRKGLPHAPHKPHTGKKDGRTALRKRADRLQKRIGLRSKKLQGGGGLPMMARKAVRRDAVLRSVDHAPDSVSLKPRSSIATPDSAWKAGVCRLTCGARDDRFELLRRLSLGNIAFVASMPDGTAGAAPSITENWWRDSVCRGWQLQLNAGEVVIAGGRAKWRGGGPGGGGRLAVLATGLEGHTLSKNKNEVLISRFLDACPSGRGV